MSGDGISKPDIEKPDVDTALEAVQRATEGAHDAISDATQKALDGVEECIEQLAKSIDSDARVEALEKERDEQREKAEEAESDKEDAQAAVKEKDKELEGLRAVLARVVDVLDELDRSAAEAERVHPDGWLTADAVAVALPLELRMELRVLDFALAPVGVTALVPARRDGP